MAKFKIQSIDQAGQKHDEVIEAADQNTIFADMRTRNVTVISIEEVSASAKKSFLSSLSMPFGKVKLRDKIIFTRNLSAMLDAGLSLSRALAVIEKQTRQKLFKSVVSGINKNISQGKTLSDSMLMYADTFPQLMISMVKAGEESGSLAQSLRIVGNQMENSYNLNRKIRGAMMYPAVILVAMVIIGFFMLTFVVPTLSQTFKDFNAELPIQTKVVIVTSDFFAAHYIIVVLLAFIVVAGVYFALKSPKGKRFSDYFSLRLPVIGFMVKEVNAARTARTLSSLLSAGVDVVVATKITADVLQNSYYKEVIAIVEEKIQKGQPIADVFAQREDLYPIFVSEMISVGEETGQLAQMLLGVAVYYENDVDQKTKDMSSIIEPVLMVVIGLAVGFFAISMISPIYSLSNTL
jgi:type IV pilus assembly protein PilC